MRNKTSLRKIAESLDADDFIDSPGNVETLQKFLEEFAGYTYPEHILERRLKLLKKLERVRVLKNWQELHRVAEIIDEIISKRADLEGDKWE